ncbi:MAG: ATP-grasp domain-containing protein [Tumebacillaceae bacterium]
MRTIVFIDTNKSGSSREAIQAAENLGYFTVVLTDRESLLRNRTEFPDVHQMLYVEIDDPDAIRKQLRTIEKQGRTIEAILSFVDPYVSTATLLADEWGVNRFSTKAVQKMEDKVLTRLAIKGSSLCPYYDILEKDDSLSSFLKSQERHLPLIVKSPKSCGSKDVHLAKNLDQLDYAIEKLNRRYPSEPVLVEEYLDGPQFLVEAIVHQGAVRIVAVLQQEIEHNKRFIVTGYALLADVPAQMMDSLEKAVTKIVTYMGMENGSCHLEWRFVRGKWKLIEINPRISGGAMNKMIRAAYGINLVQETIKLALGETPNLERQQEKFVFAQFVTISKSGYLEKVTGRHKAQQYPGVQEVYIKPRKGTYLTPPYSMGQRYAYVLVAADSMEEASQTAKEAANEIQFHLST